MDAAPDLRGMADALTANARDLDADLEWFARVLQLRLEWFFRPPDDGQGVIDLSPPDLTGRDSTWARFLAEHGVSPPVRLVLLLALAPHLRPELLDAFFARNEATGRGFTEFGGVQGINHGGFIPTGETAAFLLAGDHLEARFRTARLFDGDQFLARHGLVTLGPVAAGESPLGGALLLSRDHLLGFTTGCDRRPAFGGDFPARLIQTPLDWRHLVLPDGTLDQLDEIQQWVRHGDTLLGEWGMARTLRPGFTSLFHGAPGTGKTLSACLLGKHCDCDVYRVDLSMVVSKFIGETEKNLARVFDQAEHRHWILFFDEADALFGKRTRVDDAHDRYANQEISYLLQRIEDFDGVVILASNMKGNIDDAFVRRFQSVVHFPMPRPAERLRIWRESLPPVAELEDRLDLPRLADQHELSGGTIVNVIRHASLKALSRGSRRLLLADVEEGVRRELLKEGRAA